MIRLTIVLGNDGEQGKLEDQLEGDYQTPVGGDVAWAGVNSGHVQTVRILDFFFFFLRNETMRFADGLDTCVR